MGTIFQPLSGLPTGGRYPLSAGTPVSTARWSTGSRSRMKSLRRRPSWRSRGDSAMHVRSKVDSREMFFSGYPLVAVPIELILDKQIASS